MCVPLFRNVSLATEFGLGEPANAWVESLWCAPSSAQT
jgi:hypothetical protein